MPITLTTLNNTAAVAKTFAERFADKKSHEWVNETDSVSNKDSTIVVYNDKGGRAPVNGMPVRRFSVVHTIKVPVQITVNGSTRTVYEQVQCSVTVVKPELMSTLTLTDVYDAIAFCKNLMDATNTPKLVAGQI